MGVLATQAAADATVDHAGDGVDAQQVGVVLERQRRAPRQANAGMVAGAHVFVDTVLDSLHSLAAFQAASQPRPDAALPLQLAFAFGDDDFQAVERTRERLLQRAAHCVDLVGVHGPQPLHAHALERGLDHLVLVRKALVQVTLAYGKRLRGIVRRVQDVLRSGGRGVAVLHDHQHGIVSAEQR